MKKLGVTSLLIAFVLMVTQFVGQATFASSADVHWAYEGEAGPEHWGDLSPDYATCSKGVEQSPIDIPESAPVNLSGIAFQYLPSGLTIGNNGHTIKVDYDKGSSIEVDGKTYNLVQFHFHALSEHTIAGAHSDMEVHFVNQSSDGSLAVVGALIHEGDDNAAYDAIMAHLPAEEGTPETIEGVKIDADDLLPADHSYYRYNGSLTTPPCSEGVKWLLITTPLEMSDAQIASYEAIYPENARPVQPFNDRTFFGGSDVTPGMPTTGGLDFTFPIAALILLGLSFLSTGIVISRRKI